MLKEERGLISPPPGEGAMYSPKIDEDLIPALYQQAKAQGVPMTRLVNEYLYKAIYGGMYHADKRNEVGLIGSGNV